MSTKTRLRDTGFLYKDIGDVRVTVWLNCDSVVGKGYVKAQKKGGDVLEKFSTRSPAAQFEGLIEKYR